MPEDSYHSCILCPRKGKPSWADFLPRPPANINHGEMWVSLLEYQGDGTLSLAWDLSSPGHDSCELMTTMCLSHFLQS